MTSNGPTSLRAIATDAVLAISIAALAVLALVEVAIHFPIAWQMYASIAGLFAMAVFIGRPFASVKTRCGAVVAVVVVVGVLYSVEWSTRKPFLQKLDRVRIGMDVGEVRRVMAGYMEGTGWPAPPQFGTNSSERGELHILGSGSKFVTTNSASGEMQISDSLVFRHSNKGEFNADFGIVQFKDGRVVRVEFSPD